MLVDRRIGFNPSCIVLVDHAPFLSIIRVHSHFPGLLILILVIDMHASLVIIGHGTYGDMGRCTYGT